MLNADVAVIGSGLIANAIALAVADRGLDVTMIAGKHAGAASPAAAGLLAPSIERFAPGVREFALAARARFPAFVREIEERAHASVPFDQLGILDLALTETQAVTLRARLTESTVWLDDAELRQLEPALAPTLGGVLWQEDGAVDNVALLAALEVVTRRHPGISRWDGNARAVEPRASGATVRLDGDETVACGTAVLAAGAWSAQVGGCDYAASVEPVRGQLVALQRTATRRPIHCDDSYLVPRAGQTVAGSTMEWVGYAPETTAGAVATLAGAAAVLCPILAGAPIARSWAGLRPVTPDRLPLIGRDPRQPALIYACGHSRNGILMAQVTAIAVSEIIFEDSLTFDLSQFRPDRFGDTFRG
jgi:glycine oxidase